MQSWGKFVNMLANDIDEGLMIGLKEDLSAEREIVKSFQTKDKGKKLLFDGGVVLFRLGKGPGTVGYGPALLHEDSRNPKIRCIRGQDGREGLVEDSKRRRREEILDDRSKVLLLFCRPFPGDIHSKEASEWLDHHGKAGNKVA